MGRHPLFHGVLFLTLAGLITRVTGAVYRILLVRLVGDEGVGLIQMTFPLYGLALTVATLGLPGALAKLLSEDDSPANRPRQEAALRLVWRLVLPQAGLILGLIWLGAGWLSRDLLSDSRTLLPLLAMPLAVAASSLGWIYRGYFQGRQNLTPSAWALLAEQGIRIPAVLLLAGLLLPYGVEYAATGAMLGLLLGEGAGALFLAVLYRRDRRQEWENGSRPRTRKVPLRPVFTNLWVMALPLLMHRLVISLTGTADVVLIPQRLEAAGYLRAEATALFGQYSGMAMPLLFLPTVLIFPVATALLPAVSAAAAEGDYGRVRRRLALALGLSLVVGILAAFAFWLAPGFLATLLYDQPEVEPLIQLLAPAAPLAYLQFTSSSALSGLGRPHLGLIDHIVGVGLKLYLLYFLTADPTWGIRGAIVASIAGYGLTALLNLFHLIRLTGWPNLALSMETREGAKKLQILSRSFRRH